MRNALNSRFTISIKISKEERGSVLSEFPSVEVFLQKAIFDYANHKKEIDEYRARQNLNAEVLSKEGQVWWKDRKHTQATKDKISKSLKATSKRQGWKGIHLLEETRKKIGLAHKGKIVSQETREKIGKANKGKKRTEEQRKKISLAKTGQKYKKRKVKIK